MALHPHFCFIRLLPNGFDACNELDIVSQRPLHEIHSKITALKGESGLEPGSISAPGVLTGSYVLGGCRDCARSAQKGEVTLD